MNSSPVVDVTAERPYGVVIAPGALSGLPGLVGGASRVAIIHPAVLFDTAEALGRSLDIPVTTIQVSDSESAKTPAVLATCWEALAAAGFTRNDVVVGLGGGCTTDLAGFVAATWLRGVRYVAVPTTVLAMVDAAVGGKTGINLPAGKNLVGAFYEPVGVLCDLDVLGGLPAAEVASGLAEIAKCGFIADPRITDLIRQDPRDARVVDSVRFAELVRRSVEVKARVVSTDLRESTSTGGGVGREALNYGHTFGHAIEKLEDFTWRHGEAISVGMVFAAEVACRLGMLTPDDVALHRQVLSSLTLPTSYHGAGWSDLRAAMALDKKSRGSQLRLVLLQGLRRPWIVTPDEDVLVDAFAAVSAEPG